MIGGSVKGSARMGLRGFLLPLALLALSGCTTFPDITQGRSACTAQPGGWCPFISDAAEDAFVYAVAATNAYQGDDDLFDLTGSTLVLGQRLEFPEEVRGTGFDYQVFERYSSSDPDARVLVERIIAFRGTDSSGVDVIYGSLREDQRLLALEYFDKERAREEHSDTPRWSVAGHSLGGALASEVSLRKPEIRAYAFNLSPFYADDAQVLSTNRTVINERGEILRNLRKFREAPAAEMFVVNCRPEASSLTKHSISKLAGCLIWIAAYHSDEAQPILKANPDLVFKPPVECGEKGKVHPGRGFAQIEPCIHRARREKND